MKTSVTRKIDELGRVVIPSDFREELGIEPGEKVEIHMDGGRVILKRAVKTDPLSEISSLKERINKAYEIAWENDIPSPTCPRGSKRGTDKQQKPLFKLLFRSADRES